MQFTRLFSQYETIEDKNEKEVYIISLLYRYFDFYDKELNLIQSEISKFPNNEYLKKRMEWHSRPLFNPVVEKSKVVPRQPLNLERKPEFIPHQSVLDKMCFIICSHHTLSLIIECLESLKASRYKNIPTYLFDVGFKDEHKEILLKMFDVKIIPYTDQKEFNNDFLMEFYIPNREKEEKRALYCHNRLFYPEYLPEYKYFFCLEPDMWIYDDRVIDEIITKTLPKGVHMYGAGVTFYNRQSSLLEKIQNQYFEKIMVLPRVYKYTTASELLQEISDENDDYEKNYSLFKRGIPLLKNDILVSPRNLEPIGIFHNYGKCSILRHPRNPTYYCPTFNAKNSLNLAELKAHILISQKILSGESFDLPHTYDQHVSLRYRVWPWQDKKEIEEKILAEVPHV